MAISSIASALVATTWTSQADFDLGTYAQTVSVPDEIQLATRGVGAPDSSIAWWDLSWGQRRCIEITSTVALAEFQLRLLVDTATPIADGRMHMNGDDLRFLASDGVTELEYWIEGPIDSPSTVIWVQVDTIPVGLSTICAYYDNPGQPGLSDPIAPFTYSAPVPLYVAVSDTQTAADVAVVSYVDGNMITDGVTNLTLDAGMVGLLPGATHTGATVISASGPVALRGVGDVRDTYVPLAFAGTSFVMPSNRFLQRFSIYAPFADATVDITVGSTVVVSGLAIPAGTTADVVADVRTGQSALIESDQPILATHRSTFRGSNADSYHGYPASMEPLFGVRSTQYLVGYLANGTSVDVTGSNGFSRTHSGDRGEGDRQPGGGSQGTGPAVRLDVTAGGPIGSIQQADGDGLESTTFWPASEHNVIYYLPTAAQYAAFACSDQGTLDLGASMIACTGVAGAPGKALAGAQVAGTPIMSSSGERFWMYYEDSATGDETNVLGPKQARKTIPSPPSATVGPEESPYEAAGTWTSEAFDTGGFPFYGDLSWNPELQPGETTVQFQVATAPVAGGPFTFVGPDATPATFFTDPTGAPLDPAHDGDQFIQIRGYLDTTDQVVTPVIEDINLTFELAGGLSGAVFGDTTPPNGVFDPGESGIAGVDVELYRDDGDSVFDSAVDTLVATTTTSAGGAYSFPTVQPATYFVLSVDATVPSSFVTPATTSNPEGPILITDGLSVSGIDFGYEPTGDVTGAIFSDLDADGVNDAEPGLDGVTVELWLDDGDGIFDVLVDTLVGKQVTAGGVYAFVEVAPDVYFVRADTSTVPDDHDPVATTSNPAGPLALLGGENATADIGFQPYASISGDIGVDVEEDGLLGPADPPASGLTVELWRDDGDGSFDPAVDTLLATTTSAADGSYTFADVTASVFFVRLSNLPPPYLTTTTPDPAGPLELIPGENRTGIDFGLTASAAVSGVVFEDLDGDGLLDSDEPGIADVLVTLWRDDGDGVLDTALDAIEATQVTDFQGSFVFGHPLAGGTFFADVDESTLPGGVLLPATTPEPVGPFSLASLETKVANFGYQFERPAGLPGTGTDTRIPIALAASLILVGLLAFVRLRLRPTAEGKA